MRQIRRSRPGAAHSRRVALIRDVASTMKTRTSPEPITLIGFKPVGPKATTAYDITAAGKAVRLHKGEVEPFLAGFLLGLGSQTPSLLARADHLLAGMLAEIVPE